MKSQSRTSSKYFTSNGFRKPCYSEYTFFLAKLDPKISHWKYLFLNVINIKMTYPEMTNAVGKVSKCGNPVKMCSM